MADEITAAGKYLLVSVPEFALDPVGVPAGEPVPRDPEDPTSEKIPTGDRRGQTMTSFLRLGAFHEHPENDEAMKRAHGLAKHALIVTSGQGGPITDPYGAEIDTSVTGVEGKGVFLDDQRIGDPPTGPGDRDAQSRLVSERLEQSAALLTRGGWWDHTDGNRISTTYGDKIDVIRGNYKMVVMHRQDNPDSGGGIDLSGGHLQDLGPASMPGASVRVEFRAGKFGQRGTWHLENTTNNFIQTSDYAGDFFEHWYGNLKQSTVGSENPVEWHETLEKPYGNPEILEKTWASKIESYTGSSAWRIPSIHEETFAESTSSKTDVSQSITETTYCDGTMTSKTGSFIRRVPAVFEETYVLSSNTKTDVLASTELSIIGSQMETTLAGTLGSLTIAAAQLDTEIIGAKGTISIIPLQGEFSLGAKLGCTIGWSHEWTIGKHHEEIRIPDKKEVAVKTAKAALDSLRSVMNDRNISLFHKTMAMQCTLQAMQVAIGM